MSPHATTAHQRFVRPPILPADRKSLGEWPWPLFSLQLSSSGNFPSNSSGDRSEPRRTSYAAITAQRYRCRCPGLRQRRELFGCACRRLRMRDHRRCAARNVRIRFVASTAIAARTAADHFAGRRSRRALCRDGAARGRGRFLREVALGCGDCATRGVLAGSKTLSEACASLATGDGLKGGREGLGARGCGYEAAVNIHGSRKTSRSSVLRCRA